MAVALQVGSQMVKAVATAPEAPGIFRFGLKPKDAGIGTLVVDIVTPEFTDRFTIPGVVVYADAEAARQQPAGELADRLNRKFILVTADVVRMAIIALLPFVTEVWQVYTLMFVVNAFTAFFTPTFQAVIPAVTTDDEFPQAISLSGATYELLGVLGPGLVGAVAAFMGARNIFFLDAVTFIMSAVLVLTLPGRLQSPEAEAVQAKPGAEVPRVTPKILLEGTRRLWTDGLMRYALRLELVAAVSGALILVNTVGYVKGQLGLDTTHYGWVMSAFGVGATVAALLTGVLDKRLARPTFVLVGALLTTLAVLPANRAGLYPLLALWLVAGAGQNWVNLTTQTIIAEQTPEQFQGRVYGAHFAWSHLWWAFAYPLAGFLGTRYATGSFLYGGLVALVLLAGTWLLSRGRQPVAPVHVTSPSPTMDTE